MIKWSTLTSAEQQQALQRPAMTNSQAVSDAVSQVIADVRQSGDDALKALTQKFDGVALTQLRLSVAQRDELAATVSAKVKDAINTAQANIELFHRAQLPQSVRVETRPGVVCEQRHTPLSSVGLYIPGGSAPLPSTVLMLGTPALVAGCDRVVLCTPPNQQGQIAAEICYAAQVCGIDEIYRVGGAQAIAALALGTESVAPVDKIFGPGNSYVTQAKQQVSLLPGGPAIDMPAGPSEVLVVADSDANPAFVASDMLSQAEHGPDSQALLVCDSESVINQVQQAVTEQLSTLSRAQIAQQAMQNARYILTDSLQQSVEVSNRYAPEHLIVQTDQAESLIDQLANAGSIFVGQWSPESAGDYASGTNHVLPTYGYARNYSSLGLVDFMRRYTIQTLSYEGLKDIGSAIMDLADAEGLDAHRQAVAIRLNAGEKA